MHAAQAVKEGGVSSANAGLKMRVDVPCQNARLSPVLLPELVLPPPLVHLEACARYLHLSRFRALGGT